MVGSQHQAEVPTHLCHYGDDKGECRLSQEVNP
jgi:hypothetical protein